MIRATYRRPWWFVPLQEGSRRAKYHIFTRLMTPTPEDLLLDLGSGAGTFLEAFYPWPERILALDVSWKKLHELREVFPAVQAVVGDGTRLPFPDGSIDLVFCNAVLEHIPAAIRLSMAEEVRRVAKRYFVVVPNRRFPFEPHSKTFFLHWLPRRHFLAALSALRKLGLVRVGADYYFELPSVREMRDLFPEALVTTALGGAHIVVHKR